MPFCELPPYSVSSFSSTFRILYLCMSAIPKTRCTTLGVSLITCDEISKGINPFSLRVASKTSSTVFSGERENLKGLILIFQMLKIMSILTLRISWKFHSGTDFSHSNQTFLHAQCQICSLNPSVNEQLGLLLAVLIPQYYMTGLLNVKSIFSNAFSLVFSPIWMVVLFNLTDSLNCLSNCST